MNVVTRTCHRHTPGLGQWGPESGHQAHAYRTLTLRGFRARRCPYDEGWLSRMLRYDIEHPSIEEQTLNELRRIRQLLENKEAADV